MHALCAARNAIPTLLSCMRRHSRPLCVLLPRQVVEILDERRLLGRVMNSHKLGQRKNCNLPGVLVDLPVLGEKDVADVQQFAAQHGMDYIFASFVQSGEDVQYIRKVCARPAWLVMAHALV